jgi:hypothetical protein
VSLIYNKRTAKKRMVYNISLTLKKKVYHLTIMKPLDVFSKFKRQIDSLNLLVLYYFHPEAESQFSCAN